MTTHAQLAAKLLREAANIFRALSEADVELGGRIGEFAALYETAADLVEHDPTGEAELVDSD